MKSLQAEQSELAIRTPLSFWTLCESRGDAAAVMRRAAAADS